MLSEQPLEIEVEISRANGEFLQLARRVNRECHRLIYRTDVRNRDIQGMLVAGLFLRALQHYQATIILLEKGLVASGKVTLRAALESVFAIRSVAASEEDCTAYINDDLVRRLELMQAARKYDYAILAQLREAATEEVVAELKSRIQAAGAKKLNPEKLSQSANLHPLYHSVYALLSSAAHSGVRDLNDYFVFEGTEGGERVKEINYAPSLDEIPDLLLTAMDFILLATDAVCRQFENVEFADLRRDLAATIEAQIDSRNELLREGEA